MELSALIYEQIKRDRRRGFSVDFGSEDKRVDQLMRDMVGLLGEMGEFANLLKKVGLGQTTPGYVAPSLKTVHEKLREELADATIYIFRIAAILEADLEKEILRKIAINDERYRELEK